MIVTLHQASRGGRVKVCQARDEDGPLRSGGGGTVREEQGSGGTAVTRESGGETEIGAEIEKGTGIYAKCEDHKPCLHSLIQIKLNQFKLRLHTSA